MTERKIQVITNVICPECKEEAVKDLGAWDQGEFSEPGIHGYSCIECGYRWQCQPNEVPTK